MLVLGIETSCDETAAAVVRDGTEALSDVVVSQIDVHKEFGGVVPELASRKHIEAISPVMDKALEKAGIAVSEIQGIGVTRGPGLMGSLLVGIGAAKGMALATGVPLVGVNHLHGHLFAVFLERTDVDFPFVGLVVSGGHTSLYDVRGSLDIRLIGKTRDDAAGEAFDKVAKLLGLGYPGGAIIEEHARGVDPGDLRFPRALLDNDAFDFSFSGLKSAVLRRAEKMFGMDRHTDTPGSFQPLVNLEHDRTVPDEVKIIAAAFQDAVIDVLVIKGFAAAEKYGSEKLVVSGGVAANGALRQRMLEEGIKRGIEPVFPSIKRCTDNGAMIAARADTLLTAGITDDLSFGAKSRW